MNDKERIEALMREYGLNPRKLALSVGVTPQNIYDIQKGRHGISKELADKISTKYLNVSRLWLLTGSGKMLWHDNDVTTIGDGNNVNNGHDQMVTVDASIIEALRKSQEQIDRLLGIIESLTQK